MPPCHPVGSLQAKLPGNRPGNAPAREVARQLHLDSKGKPVNRVVQPVWRPRLVAGRDRIA